MGRTGLGVLLDKITDVGAGTACIKICHNMIIHYHSFFLESASYNVCVLFDHEALSTCKSESLSFNNLLL